MVRNCSASAATSAAHHFTCGVSGARTPRLSKSFWRRAKTVNDVSAVLKNADEGFLGRGPPPHLGVLQVSEVLKNSNCALFHQESQRRGLTGIQLDRLVNGLRRIGERAEPSLPAGKNSGSYESAGSSKPNGPFSYPAIRSDGQTWR